MPISTDDKDKIALFCNVDRKAVIEERDKQFSIYEVPLSLVKHGLDEILVKRLGLKAEPARPLATGARWSTGSSTPSTRCGSRSSAST